jgi:hypothetical protein
MRWLYDSRWREKPATVFIGLPHAMKVLGTLLGKEEMSAREWLGECLQRQHREN